MADRALDNTEQPEASKRRERANRILDAASESVLRWGYHRTTVDDIAKQADVAKGTIYLHWKTREELFEALMLRERLRVAEDIMTRLAADPKGYTLRGFIKHSALATMDRPLLKALFLRDADVLGKLVHSDLSNAAYAERVAGFKVYLELMREHGMVREDLDLDTQAQIWIAVFMGFLLAESLMPGEFSLRDERLADLMAETVHRALETDRAVSQDDAQRLSKALARYWERATAAAQELFQQELDK